MRLVSFRHADTSKFGVFVDGGIVTPARWPSLRDAIAAKGLATSPRRPGMQRLISASMRWSCCRRSRTPTRSLRRPQLCEPRRRGRARFPRCRASLAPAQHAGAARRQHHPPSASTNFDFEGELASDRRALPIRATRERAVGGRGLHLLPRCKRARLPEALVTAGKNFPALVR